MKINKPASPLGHRLIPSLLSLPNHIPKSIKNLLFQPTIQLAQKFLGLKLGYENTKKHP